MKILADNGAEIDAKTKRLETPLHYAAVYGISIYFCTNFIGCFFNGTNY